MSELWDTLAPGWERNAAFVDEQLAAATAVLLDAAAVGAGDDVLELAAGPGGAGLAAADRVGPSGRVVLADVAPAMVAAAARRADGRAEVATMVCDQCAVAADDAAFDAVINRHGLMFVAEPLVAVREATRVLRADGRYAVMTWGAREENPWLGLILDAVGEQFGVPFPPPGVPGPFSLDDPDRLAGLLRDAGLRDVAVATVATPLHAPSPTAWWERIVPLAGPLATALEAMEPDVRDAIRQRALDSGATAAQADGRGIVLAGAALVASGRRG